MFVLYSLYPSPLSEERSFLTFEVNTAYSMIMDTGVRTEF